MEENKKRIVEMLLNKSLDGQDEEELLDLLIDQPIAIDIDKLEEQNRSFGDAVADKPVLLSAIWYHSRGWTRFRAFDPRSTSCDPCSKPGPWRTVWDIRGGGMAVKALSACYHLTSPASAGHGYRTRCRCSCFSWPCPEP